MMSQRQQTSGRQGGWAGFPWALVYVARAFDVDELLRSARWADLSTCAFGAMLATMPGWRRMAP